MIDGTVAACAAILVHLGATPEEMDAAWHKLLGRPIASLPTGVIVQVREALDEVRS